MNLNLAQPAITHGRIRPGRIVDGLGAAIGAALHAWRKFLRSQRKDAETAHAFDSIAHLNVHVLTDIGAPHWLIAQAASRRDAAPLRWSEIERR
jgi:hypothetical protein